MFFLGQQHLRKEVVAMADSRSVIVRQDSGVDVVFYTHWNGDTLPSTVANALSRSRYRWDDAPYLNRIIFSEMIQDDVLGETGFGIEPVTRAAGVDGEYGEGNPGYDLIVYIKEQMVYDGDGGSHSFEDFVKNFSE